jgi:hypothetical protein
MRHDLGPAPLFEEEPLEQRMGAGGIKLGGGLMFESFPSVLPARAGATMCGAW